MNSSVKKTIIVFIYLSLFCLLALLAYSALRPKETCFDQKKNQNEQDVDCGGVCEKECLKIDAQPLEIIRKGAVASGTQGEYDFYAEISNPNAAFGSRRFEWQADFKDAGGNSLGSKKGWSFILPNEKKYIVENNIQMSFFPSAFDFKIINSDWVEFQDYYEKPNLQIINKKYNQISDGVGFSEAKGLLKNESAYDFQTISIQVILKDEKGDVLALNSTQMKTVRSGEERDFRTFWPNSFPGAPVSVEAQAQVNIFDEGSFFQKYYKREKFQVY